MIRGKRYLLNTPREPERIFETDQELTEYVNSTLTAKRTNLQDELDQLPIGGSISLGDGRTIFAIAVVYDDQYAVLTSTEEKIITQSEVIERIDVLEDAVVDRIVEPVSAPIDAPSEFDSDINDVAASPRRRGRPPAAGGTKNRPGEP